MIQSCSGTHSPSAARMGKRFFMSFGLGLAAILALALGLAGACSRVTTIGERHDDGGNPFVGTWQRMDAEYVLRVVASPHGVRAEYSNPRPIHVSRVEVRPVAAGRELVVELRDTGYPGSTYTLRHNAASGTLDGVYFHAGLKQSFDVSFVRKPTP